MDALAHIGPSIHIKGQVTADEPLTIAGRVDGSIEVNGHALTVVSGARVKADILADTIIVGGEVNGSLNAGVRIVVSPTAHIEGDLTAPAVSLADGAVLQGTVEAAGQRALRVA
ncbi:MAG: bactofilin family protein [Betaproteobacteria bacterium]